MWCMQGLTADNAYHVSDIRDSEQKSLREFAVVRVTALVL
jgi:hypothetical protein